MDFRLLLHQRTKQLKAAMETPLRYGYYLPNVTDKCFGCGKCEKSCRANALKVEDLPDGQTRIVVTPGNAGECGICVASCSNHGIDGMKLRQLTTLGPVSIYKCTKTLCADCGKPIAPDSVDGICSVCRIKRRTKKRQEEAAARAKARGRAGRPNAPPRKQPKPPRRSPPRQRLRSWPLKMPPLPPKPRFLLPRQRPRRPPPHRQHLIAGMQNGRNAAKTIDAGANQCYTLANHLCGRRTVTKE